MYRKQLVLLFLLLADVLPIIIILGNPHLSRLALGTYREARSEEVYSLTPPNPTSARDFKAALKITESLSRVSVLHRNIFAYTDHPDSCVAIAKKGAVLQCYNIDIALIALLQQSGFHARLWALNGDDGMGGLGHNLVEVLDEKEGLWKIIDPQFHNYYTLANSSQAINLEQLRSAALNHSEALRVQYIPTSLPYESARYLIGQIVELARSASVNTNNDFTELYADRYGKLQWFAPLFDRLSLQAQRGMRALLLGSRETKLLLLDRQSPSYHPQLVHWWFVFSLALLPAISIALALSFRPRVREKPERPSKFQAIPPAAKE